jgi:hypothetical protein
MCIRKLKCIYEFTYIFFKLSSKYAAEYDQSTSYACMKNRIMKPGKMFLKGGGKWKCNRRGEFYQNIWYVKREMS